jgi:hypothetical protein
MHRRSAVRKALTFFVVVVAVAATFARGAEPDASQALPELGSNLSSFADFQRAMRPYILARPQHSPADWRAIESSLYYFVLDHKLFFRSLTTAQQYEFVGRLADVIRQKRQESARRVIFGPETSVIALLDPDRGLQRRQIDTLVRQYGAHADIFKAEQSGKTVAQVADDFLAAMRDVAAHRAPATIVVLGHGLPSEIQSYAISDEYLAEALLARAAGGGQNKAVDLSHLVFIFDDCFSADFVINLHAALERQSQRLGLTLESPPVMISSVNRTRVGYAKVDELFVPRFWEAVIQLFYVNKPLPDQVTFGDLRERVDRYMYGYGRAPIVEGGRVVDYRLVDPEQIQDPVFFVPLKKSEVDDLRKRLGLPAMPPLPAFLDAG